MELILLNGVIHTMEEEHPVVQAVAISKNRIAAVGTDDDIKKLATPDTKIIDLGGKLVLPGFTDSHLHIFEYALRLSMISLSDCRSVADIQQKIKAGITPESDYIFATAWDDTKLAEQRFPTKEELDAISTEVPISILRRCGNIAMLNSKSIEKFRAELEEVKRNREQDVGLDASGEFTGLLKGTLAISNIKVKAKPEALPGLFAKAAEVCLEKGVTSIHTDDFSVAPPDDILNFYHSAAAAGELPIRVNLQCRMPDKQALDSFMARGLRTGSGDFFFKIGPIKMVADGTLGARTAYMNEPYSDAPGVLGENIYPRDKLFEIGESAHQGGMQLAIHGIGDATIDNILDLYEHVGKKYPRPDARHRVIHGQITSAEALPRFAELKVVIDVQPPFISSDLAFVEDRVGPERVKTSYNWRTLLDMGVKLSGSSDSPIESFDPLQGIYALVTRTKLDGTPEGGWMPEQKLTVQEAVEFYTTTAAYTSFEEADKGSIKAGKLADLVVLSQNIYEIPPQQIKDVKVLTTILDGKVAFER